MKSIGFRCWNDCFAYVVLSGTQERPRVEAKEKRRCPKGMNRPAFLAWVRENVKEIMRAAKAKASLYRAVEPVSRNKPLERAELEGVLQEVIKSEFNISTVKRIKSQIKRDIPSFDGTAKYVYKVLSEKDLADVEGDDFSDAALVALCGLPQDGA